MSKEEIKESKKKITIEQIRNKKIEEEKKNEQNKKCC